MVSIYCSFTQCLGNMVFVFKLSLLELMQLQKKAFTDSVSNFLSVSNSKHPQRPKRKVELRGKDKNIGSIMM